jgi:hypothetical protein
MEHRKPEVPSDTLERRLERLERDSRRWKAMTTLAMGILSLILLSGAGKSGETSVPNEVQAHAFVLVDRNGTPLARLGLLPHGAWGLGFYDQGKKSRIVLSVEGDGASSISLFAKDGKGGYAPECQQHWCECAASGGYALEDPRYPGYLA